MEHRISIKREEAENGPYEYEFVCYVNDEPVMTAIRLEDRGASGPEDGGDSWTEQLRRYGLAYCDGLDAKPESASDEDEDVSTDGGRSPISGSATRQR